MKSSLLRLLVLCFAGAVAGAGLGWVLRGFHPAFKTATLQRKEAAAASAEPAAGGAKPVENSSPSEKAKFTGGSSVQAAAQQAGALRWLHLLGAAETAKAEDMPRLLRLAGYDTAVVKLLGQHWAELDAPHLFRYVCGIADAGGPVFLALHYALFEEWPKRDPEAAIAALSDIRVLPGLKDLRWSLINTIMKTDPARSLRLLGEWNIHNYSPNSRPLDAWAVQDPRKAAQAVVKAGIERNPVMQSAMTAIGKAWAATDPAAALDFARKQRSAAGTHLIQSVITEWSIRDTAAALAYVSAQTDSIVKGAMAGPLVREWAKKDPQAAMTWAAEHLKGEARMTATALAVSGMAEKDVRAAAAYVTKMEPGGLKNQAVAELAFEWLNSSAVSIPEREKNQSAALMWMVSLPEPDARERAFGQTERLLLSRWKSAETIAFLESEYGAQAPQSLFNQAARHLAKNDPEAALKWTENLSAERQPGARQGVLSEWINSRPEAALEWVRGLPAGEERDGAIQTVSGALSGERAQAWRESLPPQDRPAEAGTGN